MPQATPDCVRVKKLVLVFFPGKEGGILPFPLLPTYLYQVITLIHLSHQTKKKNPKKFKNEKKKNKFLPFISGIITHRQKQFHGSDSIFIFPRPSAFLSFCCIGNGSLQGEAQVCGTREISQRLQGPRHASPRPHSGSCWSPVGRKLSPDRSRVRELLLFQLRALSLLMVLFNFLSLSNLASYV